MPQLELVFESGESSLSVRRFAVREEMSGLFSVSVWARSTNEDIDLDELVGRSAAFIVKSGLAFSGGPGERRWVGVCERAEQVEVEPTGLSMYHVHIAPALWLLTQKTDNRLFQHQNIPAILERVFQEWRIRHRWAIDGAEYPPIELRTQYGETDLAFVSRLLEETGISYFFEDDAEQGTLLVLADNPGAREARSAGPLPFVDNPNQAAEREFVSEVQLAREVRPGKVSLRDHDFRRRPDYVLLGATRPVLPETKEDDLELYRYRPGLSVIEQEAAAPKKAEGEAQPTDTPPPPPAPRKKGPEPLESLDGDSAPPAPPGVASSLTPAAKGHDSDASGGSLGGKVAQHLAVGSPAPSAPGSASVGDDKGVARHEDRYATWRAKRELESARTGRKGFSYATNALDLAPGTVFSIGSLDPAGGLSCHPRTDIGPERRLLVIESRIEGTHDGAWHMSGHALFADDPCRPPLRTPRPIVFGVQSAVVVGPPGEEIYTDEIGRVRVQFHWDRDHEYDPDSSSWMRVAHGWAGPGYGFVTIPRVGHEVLVAFMDGNPDMPVVVGSLHNGTARTPQVLPEQKTRSTWRSSTSPGGGGYNELAFEDLKGKELVYVHAERDMQQIVRHDRAAIVGQVDTNRVGKRYDTYIADSRTHIEMVKRRITLTTGDASIVLDGPNIRIVAKGKITVKSEGNDVEIQGGPMVKINPGAQAPPPKPIQLPPELPKREPVRLPVLPGSRCVKLGPNKIYKAAILKASERTGLPPETIAAVISAEASRDDVGTWKPDSYNPKSGAAGLTQFLGSTWDGEATRRGTYLNEQAVARGLVREVPNKNPKRPSTFEIVPGKRGELRQLRYDPELSIVAAAEYDNNTLKALQADGTVPRSLSPDEAAKQLYLGHHEGEEGARSFTKGTLTDKRARYLLPVQVGPERAAKLLAAAGGDAKKAYTSWLNGYIDANIRPSRYRCSKENVDGDDTPEAARELEEAKRKAEQKRQARARKKA